MRIGIGIASGRSSPATPERASERLTPASATPSTSPPRLEAYTKEAKRSIVFDGATATAVGSTVTLDALGSVVMRGKTMPTELFAVPGY